MTPTPLHLLRTVFGHAEFRDRQGEIVDHLIAGGDALVVMPTGGGKSVCYQLPALVRPGAGVVVSPLIALMQDQVAALRQLGIRAEDLESAPAGVRAQAVCPDGTLMDDFLVRKGDRVVNVVNAVSPAATITTAPTASTPTCRWVSSSASRITQASSGSSSIRIPPGITQKILPLPAWSQTLSSKMW